LTVSTFVAMTLMFVTSTWVKPDISNRTRYVPGSRLLITYDPSLPVFVATERFVFTSVTVTRDGQCRRRLPEARYHV
jgi:hypothetical protein